MKKSSAVPDVRTKYLLRFQQERKKVTAVTQLISSIRRAAVNADWLDEGLAEAIIYAENCIPKHLR